MTSCRAKRAKKNLTVSCSPSKWGYSGRNKPPSYWWKVSWNLAQHLCVLSCTSAGNAAVVKPSEVCVHTAKVMEELLPLYIDKVRTGLVKFTWICIRGVIKVKDTLILLKTVSAWYFQQIVKQTDWHNLPALHFLKQNHVLSGKKHRFWAVFLVQTTKRLN